MARVVVGKKVVVGVFLLVVMVRVVVGMMSVYLLIVLVRVVVVVILVVLVHVVVVVIGVFFHASFARLEVERGK